MNNKEWGLDIGNLGAFVKHYKEFCKIKYLFYFRSNISNGHCVACGKEFPETMKIIMKICEG